MTAHHHLSLKFTLMVFQSSVGQLENLVYLKDTYIIILKSFRELKNAIGAQTIDLDTGKWCKLNNVVMIFDEGHPLLYKFIQEFALTFNGKKWGHNGPYLVSTVVSRVTGRPGYNFIGPPPMAFYLVDWSKIGSLSTQFF
ncbi:UNVERIFIED_CONTAM: hypothetical protein Sradi_3794300 [Sesamum radiatum]|uniref:Alpha 1,4-glycosyltransferase domain-containing protein n=1 Tax=Sesamum radiatum TaxID=300843 RepID=A0AAW2Q033_SESRA